MTSTFILDVPLKYRAPPEVLPRKRIRYANQLLMERWQKDPVVVKECNTPEKEDEVVDLNRVRKRKGNREVEEAEGMEVVEEVAKKGNGKVNTQAPDEVVVEVVAKEAAKAAGQTMEMGLKDSGKAEKKSRKPRATPPPKSAKHSYVFEKLGSRELFLKASVGKLVRKRRNAKKETRYLTPRTAYTILGLVLTRDSTKSLVWDDVFFDSQLFETPRVSTAHYNYLPYDASELGVKKGTKVQVECWEGKVKSVKHGDVVLEVEGRKDQKETVLFVLRHAKENQGVTSLEEAQRQFILNLGEMIALTHIFAPIFIQVAPERTHKENMYIDFTKEIAKLTQQAKSVKSLTEYRDAVEKSNPMIWGFIRRIPAQETIRLVPDSFSEDLKKFIKLPGSLMDMLGFYHLKKEKVLGPDVAEAGIFGANKVIRGGSNAEGFIFDLAKSLQEASKLGRFINLQSVTAPLTAGREYKSLLENVENGREELMLEKKDLFKWADKGATTWATKALLCLGASFIPSIPLGSIRIMSRDSKLNDNTKGAYFSHMQVLESVRQQSMPDGDTRDLDVFKKISTHFHPTTVLVRRNVEKAKQLDGQFGNSSKVEQGKMPSDLWGGQKLVKRMVEKLLDEAYELFVNKVCVHSFAVEGKGVGMIVLFLCFNSTHLCTCPNR